MKEFRPSETELYLEDQQDIVLSGRVYDKTEKEKYQVLYLKNNSIPYHQQSLKESRLIIYDEEKHNISIGDVLTIQGSIRFFQPAPNPGNFDAKLYYQKQNIHASVWAESIQKTGDGRYTLSERIKNHLHRFRQKWRGHLYEAMGDEDGGALSAVLLGERQGVDEDLKTLYQINGIAHILAVSGLHLSFIGIGIYQILRRLTGSYTIGGACGILFLVLYILMIGLTVSAVRALIMFLFRVGAEMTGRRYDAPTALSAAAVAVLLWRPLSLYDGGFWLSFGAVFAVLTVVPVVQDVFSRTESASPAKACIAGGSTIYNNGQHASSVCVYLGKAWKQVWQMIMQGLTASIGINLVIFPILLYYFFEFPIYSFILNIFVIPLMSVLLFLGMEGSLFASWVVPLSVLPFRICSKILWIYKMSCEIMLRLPGARLVIGRPDTWQIIVYYGTLFLGLLILRYILLMKKCEERRNQSLLVTKCGKKRDHRKQENRGCQGNQRKQKAGWAVVLLWAVGIVILTVRFEEAGKLTTVVLDVGQGDGIFMKGPKGGTYLVDGGSSDVKKVGQYRLESFLKSQGVGVIDYVLISHGDSDHTNGVEELIERQEMGVKIGTLVLPVQEVWDEALAGLAEKAKAYGIRVAVMEAGQSIREGNMTITCIQPGKLGTETEHRESEIREPEVRAAEGGYESGNAASMVLAVKFGEFDMLLTGDVEGEGEGQLTEQLEEQYRGCTWEVLKVAHHGSKNSSSEEFLRQVKPAYAFISAGQENRYGHPHQETIERLADVGSKVYSTQEKGALIVEVEDGETMKVGSYWSRSEQ